MKLNPKNITVLNSVYFSYTRIGHDDFVALECYLQGNAIKLTVTLVFVRCKTFGAYWST